MSGLAVLALVATAVWLGLLTLAVLVCVRQVAVLTVRFEMGLPRVSLANDGLQIGHTAPARVLDAIPEVRDGLGYVLLASAICVPCRQLIPQLADHRVNETIVALLAGSADVAAGFAELFPPWIRVIRDPEASAIATLLELKSTPFAVEIDTGRVTGKAFLYEVSDLLRLIEARRSGAREFTPRRVEVVRDVG